MADKSEPPAVTLARLEDKVDGIILTQQSHARSIKWITTAALLIIGAIGGPDAVSALTGGPV